MPNHVRNIVKTRGIGNLPLYGMDENGVEYFDFQKIIPMPEALNMDSGSKENIAIEAAFTRIAREVNRICRPIFRVMIARSAVFQNCRSLEEEAEAHGMTLREAEELGLKYLDNIIKYGHSSWYDWRVENWGTKWNSYDLDRIDDDTIAFSTAWANPEPIIKKLSAKYPDLIIEHWWADEDIGMNTGYRCIQNGCEEVIEPPDCGPYALENYVKCWGMDDALRRNKDGELYVISETAENAVENSEAE